MFFSNIVFLEWELFSSVLGPMLLPTVLYGVIHSNTLPIIHSVELQLKITNHCYVLYCIRIILYTNGPSLSLSDVMVDCIYQSERVMVKRNVHDIIIVLL